MSLTRETLIEINQKLQAALRTVSEENNRLHEENSRLIREVATLSHWSRQETERYRKLVRYIQKLRTWLHGNEAAKSESADSNDGE